jgi:hypothetical protein
MLLIKVSNTIICSVLWCVQSFEATVRLCDLSAMSRSYGEGGNFYLVALTLLTHNKYRYTFNAKKFCIVVILRHTAPLMKATINY